ncbi:MAG: IMP dehydrogenase [Actinomycetota bacterium]
MQELPLGLTYDDVVLVPRRSRIGSRRDVSTRSLFTQAIEIEIPIVSANMDTVTTAPMAIAMAQLGGIGVIHRFLTVAEQSAEVKRVKRFLNYVVEDPYTIGPGRTVGEALDEALRHDVTGLVVTDGQHRPVGILTARDVRAAPSDSSVSEVMTPARDLVTASPGVSLEEARDLMNQHRIEKLPLVEDGRLSGLITLRDLELHERYPVATRDERGRLRVGAAVGVRGGYLERAEALIDADADILVLDIAHGHADHALDAVTELKKSWPDAQVVAGNVATAEGFRDLVAAGADAVKVGIGPGFACSTRIVAGVGVPQLTAVMECAEAARGLGVPLIADGGIRKPGDVAKAIGAGASSVMVGSVLAGRSESPGEVVRRKGTLYKVFRGMASRSAAASRLSIEGRADALDQYVPEGEEIEFPLRGPVAEVVTEMVGGLRSGMSYTDAGHIEEFWDKATFVRQTESGRRESRPGTPDQ